MRPMLLVPIKSADRFESEISSRSPYKPRRIAETWNGIMPIVPGTQSSRNRITGAGGIAEIRIREAWHGNSPRERRVRALRHMTQFA